MTTEHPDANPEGVNEDSGEDLSPEALISRAFQKQEAPSEPEKEEETEETSDSSESVNETETQEQEGDTEETESKEESQESEESEEGEDSVLSQIDFEALDEEGATGLGEYLASHATPEQAAIIAQAMGTKGGQEYGKMRGQLRAKDKEIENLKSQVNEGIAKVVSGNNPHSDITSVETLEEREQQDRQSYEYLDNLLTDSTDEYFTINGQEVDRKTANQWRKHFDAQLKAIPERKKALEDLGNLSNLRDEELKKAKESVDFLNDEDSEEYKAWKQEVESPAFSLLAQAFPKEGAKLAAMAAKAMAYDSKPGKPKAPKIPIRSKNKPVTDTGSGAAKPGGRGHNKQRQKLHEKIDQGEFGDRDVQNLIAGAFSR